MRHDILGNHDLNMTIITQRQEPKAQRQVDIVKVKLQPQWCRLGPSGTGCNNGGSTRLITYTSIGERSNSPAMIVKVLEQESKEPFTPSPSLIY